MSDGGLTINIGKEDEPIRSGFGCILWAIAFAIVAWALGGFPGLPR